MNHDQRGGKPFEEDQDVAPDSGDQEAVEAEIGQFDPGSPPADSEPGNRRLADQLAEANDRHLRLAADFDNFRKRVARERLELGDRAQAAFVVRLLDVLDDLDRLAATEIDGPPDAVRQGVEMVDRKLRKELEQAGLERIDPAGQRFDPAVAEAVSVLAPPTPDQDHEVSATFQVGYLFKGTLVRPAKVQVYSSEGHA